MRVYRLKGGQYAYGGHVVNILQDVTGFTTSLPRLAADIPVLVVRRQGGEAKSHKDFVAQNHLQKHVIILCSFFSFQTSAYTHTADDSYKHHRTRVRSDSYTILNENIVHWTSNDVH